MSTGPENITRDRANAKLAFVRVVKWVQSNPVTMTDAQIKKFSEYLAGSGTDVSNMTDEAIAIECVDWIAQEGLMRLSIGEIHQRLIDRFGAEVVRELKLGVKDPWIEIASDRIADVASFVHDDPELAFDALNDLCGADWLETDAKKKAPCEPHVEVVYHLYSYTHKHFLKLKVKVPRWKNGVAGELPQVPTVSHVWGIADWHEREAYDLVGIDFTDHPNLRRILCPEDWEGHPLRKDYDFPLEYHGVRGK